MVYALTCWRQRHMMYFAYLTIVVTINILGYYLEVTSATLEAAIIACKVAYVGIPLSGVMLFMFSLDYSDRVNFNLPFRIFLFALAPLFTIAVFAYPASTLFYESLSFSNEGLVSHLIVQPGILYYPCLIFVTLLTILALVNLVVSFFRQKRFEGIIIFLIAIFVPLFAQIYIMVFGLIDGWNPQRTALGLSIVLLAIYLAFYKQAEWQSVGRELVVQEMDDAFILLDNKGIVIDYNLSALSYFPQLKQTTTLCKLVDLWEFPQENYGVYATHEYDIEQDGATKNLHVTTSQLDANGKVTGTLVVISDNTTNNLMLQELTRRARIDELTGLNNRATFFHDSSLSFDLAMRQKETKGCALMIDIAYFKLVNDTYGHATGDEVLIFIGQLIRSRFRRTDITGRYGGEEMSVWMPSTSLQGAFQVAEELRLAVEAKFYVHGDESFNVTISTGIACLFNANPESFEDLMKKADYALYEAKNTGRNKICVYSDNTPHAIRP